MVKMLLEAGADPEAKTSVSRILCVYVSQVVLVFMNILLLCFLFVC